MFVVIIVAVHMNVFLIGMHRGTVVTISPYTLLRCIDSVCCNIVAVHMNVFLIGMDRGTVVTISPYSLLRCIDSVCCNHSCSSHDCHYTVSSYSEF